MNARSVRGGSTVADPAVCDRLNLSISNLLIQESSNQPIK